MLENLSIIVVTFNSSAHIDDLLKELTRSSAEIIVVDNASQDGTLEALAGFDVVKIIRNETNLGFAKAVNLGLHIARRPHVLLLNPDARIRVQDAAECLEAMARLDLDIAAPLVVSTNGRLRVLEVGREPRARRLALHFSGLSLFARRYPRLEGLYLRPKQATSSREVDWVSGACFFARRDLFIQLGGLSTRWFMYAEDVKFCLDAKRAGAKVGLVTSATATHVMGASSSRREQGPVSSDWVLNLLDLYRVHYQPSLLRDVAWRLIAGAGLMSRAVAFCLLAAANHNDLGPIWRRDSTAFRLHASRVMRARRRVRTGR